MLMLSICSLQPWLSHMFAWWAGERQSNTVPEPAGKWWEWGGGSAASVGCALQESGSQLACLPPEWCPTSLRPGMTSANTALPGLLYQAYLSMSPYNLAVVHMRSKSTAHACPMTMLQYSMQSNALWLACVHKKQCLELPMHACMCVKHGRG